MPPGLVYLIGYQGFSYLGYSANEGIGLIPVGCLDNKCLPTNLASIICLLVFDTNITLNPIFYFLIVWYDKKAGEIGGTLPDVPHRYYIRLSVVWQES